MKRLFLQSIWINLIFMPAALIGLLVGWITNWEDSPIPWWIGMGLWWPILYLVVRAEGNPTPIGQWLSKTIGRIYP